MIDDGRRSGPPATPAHLPLHRTRSLRSDERRSLALFAGIVTVTMLGLLVPTWLRGDTDLLPFLTPLGMWAPALAAVAASRLLVGDLPLRQRLALAPAPPLRRLVRQMLGVFAAIGAVAVATLLLGHALGVAPLDLEHWSGFRAGDPSLSLDEARRQVLLTTLALPLFALGYMVLTIGEEVGWRGYAQTTLAPLGFWRSSFVIGAFWAVWHVPLIATFAFAGDAPWWELPIVAVNLTLAGAFLSVVRALSGSVWPAAFGHAMLNTAMVFASSAPMLDGARDHPTDQLAVAAVGWAVWAVALVVAAPLVRRRLGPRDAA